MNKTYKPSPAAQIKSIAVHTLTISFCAAILFLAALGDITAAFSVIHLSLIGSIVYEYATAVSVTVRMDGILYKRGGNSRELRYEMYYFSGDEKNGLRAEDRRTGRTEVLKCTGFDKKLIRSMIEQISKAQREYFLRRSSAGEFKSGAEMKQTASTAAAEASKRNPYSKNYQPPSEQKSAAPKAAEMPKPAVSVTKPAPKPDPASDIAVIEGVTKSFEKEIPKDYNRLPEVTLDDAAYRAMPEIKPVTVTAPPEAEKKTEKTAPTEEFSKIEFRYPKREIMTRTSHANELTVLWSLLISVAAFLVWYLAAGIYAESILPAVLFIVMTTAAVSGMIIGRRLVRTKGIFSKLEITEKFLIIDNKRYRFEKMSDMRITSPDAEVGIRRILFKCDGEIHSYSMGNCRVTNDKRDIYAFPRYRMLCEALKKRGFTW